MVWSLISGTAKGSGGWADGLSYTVCPPTRALMFSYQRGQFRRLCGSAAVWWALPYLLHGEQLLMACVWTWRCLLPSR